VRNVNAPVNGLCQEGMIKLARLNEGPEIFFTIQGEGKSIGRPSVFVRLSLCNLYCYWCDTDFTWNWIGTKFRHQKDSLPGYSKFSKDAFMVSLPDEEIIRAIRSYPCDNLVFTGGEPLAQQKELGSLLSSLTSANPAYHIEIETNGTIVPSQACDPHVDQYNVSVKLANSKVSERERIKPEAIHFFARSEKSNFKFVIDLQSDMDEVLNLVREFQIDKRKVYLMPQGINAATLQGKQQWLVEKCKEFGFNYTDRIHIHIYGDKRGV
jgi:7-carboxy-7-deazaguanine synthase